VIQRWPDAGQRGDGRQAAPYYRGAARPRPAVPQSRAYAYNQGGYYPRGYYAPRYYGGGYYWSPRPVYAVPYGYRPYGYRPGWSFNPSVSHPGGQVYGGQPARYTRSHRPAYGALRIVDAPRDARVFVDGFYAGEVDDYDGIFQRLNLEAGAHQIEVEVDPVWAPGVRRAIVPGDQSRPVDGRY
jgi:hypothetical protein